MKKRLKKLSKTTKQLIKDYITEIWHIICRPELGMLPGQLAFFMLLSMVPMITLIIGVAGLFDINADVIYNMINGVVPGGAEFLKSYFTIGTNFDIVMVLVFIWMLYIASSGFNQVILISNQIYGIQQSNFIKRRIKSLFLLIFVVLLLIFVLVVPIFGLKILNLLNIEITAKVMKIYGWVKGPITWFIMFVFIRGIYEIAPDRLRKGAHVNTGALFTSIGWVVVTLIYSHLANNMTTYNFIYGALANIAFLMIWLYFICFIFMIGMALSYGREIDNESVNKAGAIKVVKNR